MPDRTVSHWQTSLLAHRFESLEGKFLHLGIYSSQRPGKRIGKPFMVAPKGLSGKKQQKLSTRLQRRRMQFINKALTNFFSSKYHLFCHSTLFSKSFSIHLPELICHNNGNSSRTSFFFFFFFSLTVWLWQTFHLSLSFTFTILHGQNDPFLITIFASPPPPHYIVRIYPLGLFALLFLSLIFRGYPLSSNSSPSWSARCSHSIPLSAPPSRPPTSVVIRYFRSGYTAFSFDSRLATHLFCN